MPKMELIWMSLLMFSVLSGIAQAEVSQSGDPSVICRMRKEVRTLRIEKGEGGKCKAVYTKLGRDQYIGAASSGASCLEILQRVRVNLEAASWKCREIKDSRVSNLIEM
jgi:hypothetical protein